MCFVKEKLKEKLESNFIAAATPTSETEKEKSHSSDQKKANPRGRSLRYVIRANKLEIE